jgi:hypothetical protein
VVDQLAVDVQHQIGHGASGKGFWTVRTYTTTAHYEPD